MKIKYEVTAIMAQRAVGEDDVWKGAPVAKKFNFKEESYWQLLMGVTGNVKSGWRKFTLQNSTTTSRAKGGSYKRRKCVAT